MAPKTSPESEDLELTLSDQPGSFDLEKQKDARGWAGKQGIFVGIGIGMAIAAGGMILLPRLSSRPATAPQATASTQSVTVATVERTLVVRTLKATGTVAASDLLPVLPQATGIQIQQVMVDEGDTVKAEQVMAVLDNSVLQAQLDQARAQLTAAQAMVRQKQAAVSQAQATLAEAQTNRNRYRDLARQGAISRQESESRNTAATTTQEQVRVAQADVSSAEAEVQSRRAQLQQLQTQLEQTVVRAPAGGIVAERIARVGDMTNGTQKLFSIIRNGALELQVKIPETQLPGVRIGLPVQVTSSSDQRMRSQGSVREIAPLVDPQNRQATVEIALPPSSLLRPGMFLQATIASNTAQGLTIPASAVLPQSEGDKAIVYRLQGDTARAQPVEVGETIGEGEAPARVEIKSGLALGDRVIVHGAGFVKDGDRVQVEPAPPKAEAPGNRP